MRRIAAFLFVSLFAALIAAPAFSQGGSATITGLIVDSTKARVPGAKVVAIDTDTKVQYPAVTNKEGEYTISALPVGPFRIEVEKPGFKTILKEDLFLHTADALEINFHMAVGSVSESVTVNGEATNESPAVSLTVSREFIEDAPLNGRSLQDLIQLAPGAVNVSSDGDYLIDGQREESNNFTVDGMSVNLGGAVNANSTADSIGGDKYAQTELGTTQSLVSVDDLQEFKVQTSGYSAEYGRSPGGQFSLTTRSGTNELHGTLFEYLRNTFFDANSWENDHNGNPQTAEHQNDYGGTVGGPLLIPRVYNGKDRSFYFVSLERLKLLTPSYESLYEPTQAFRNWVSPNIAPFVDAEPLPNASSPGNQDGCTITDPSTGQLAACDALYSHGYSNPSQLYNTSVRLDHSFDKKLHGFIRFADTPSSGVAGASETSDTTVNVLTATAGLTATISDSMLNDLRFNYSQDAETAFFSTGTVQGAIPTPRNDYIAPGYDSRFAGGTAFFIVPGSSIVEVPVVFGGGSNLDQRQVVDSLSWTRGNHALKIGADWRRYRNDLHAGGARSFIEALSLSDFQKGTADYVSVSDFNGGAPVFDNISLYAQDHWKLNPRLAIDYGLRWELNPPPGASNGHYPVTPSSDNLTTATLTNDGKSTYHTQYEKIAPRFGFSWNAITSEKHPLTVRGGFGIFYDTGQSALGSLYYDAYPFYLTAPASSNVTFPLTSSVLAPPKLNQPLTTPYPNSTFTISPELTLPYTEQWNLSLDTDLNPKNVLTLSYVGNSGKKLLFATEESGAAIENPNFTYFSYTYNGSSSNYNALQIQDKGRVLSGLEVIASFTLAHALDNGSVSASSATAPIYGNSDYDIRRQLNLAMNYKLPSADVTRSARALTHGWLLANRFSTQSGSPLQIVQTNTFGPAGNQLSYYPDLVAGVPIYLHGRAADLDGQPVPASWRLNQNAFSLVPTDSNGNPVRQGTLGRNYVRGTSFWALNSAVQRTFPIYDQLHLNFRAEAFNILNHPNFGNTDTYLSDSTFGQVGGGSTIGSSNQFYAMGAARSLQFSLKLQF